MKSLITAFSMYSRIPMPHIKWDERCMRYVMCFFPFIGAVIGAVIWIIGKILFKLAVPPLLFAAVMTVIPVMITGGIHLDGLIDTADALSSYGDTKKRLEIMKDPHIGAFAVIWTAVYFVLSLGLWSGIKADALSVIAVSFVLSRTLSGLAVVCFKTAKNTGLAAMFADAAQKTKTRIALLIWLVLCAAFLMILNVKYGSAVLAAAALAFLWHWYNCYRNFGGITGDLAGAFLQICELAAILAVTVVSYI